MEHIKPLSAILAAMNDRDAASIALVTKAYTFSQAAHGEQKRYSGDLFFIHPAAVAFLLAEAGLDAPSIAAGLLHDVVEDTNTSHDTIEQEFGTEVATLVDAVTKLGTVRYQGSDRHIESLRKLFAATASDIRVLIVKLMDRLHNSQSFGHLPSNKVVRITRETLEIYAPIADRLGMGALKQQLEDAAFPFAYPDEYKKLQALLAEHDMGRHEDRLHRIEQDLKRDLADYGIRNFRTESRIKGMYSLFRKLERKSWDFSQILDVVALRVILPTVADCYSVLGIIHAHWRPVPGKIKDYIACPKPNGYRSIHTTVYSGDGGALEIQLRTEDMHREALYGIASHLAYKEKQHGLKVSAKSGIEWVKQFFPRIGAAQAKHADSGMQRSVPDWIKQLARHDGSTSDEYMDSLRADFFNHRVFVFTPKGDVIDLPVDATTLDLAYNIHSDVGNTATGARINGKMVTLHTHLHNGDIVEIITKKNARPSAKWLDYVKTTMAKRHIRSAIGKRENNH